MVSGEITTKKRGRGRLRKPSDCLVCGATCDTRRSADDHCKGVIRWRHLECRHCGTGFKAKKDTAGYCSYQCRALALINECRRCLLCDRDFQASTREQKYCGAECSQYAVASKAHAKAIKATCKQCGVVFQPKRGRYASFCSRECYFLLLRANKGTDANKRKNRRIYRDSQSSDPQKSIDSPKKSVTQYFKDWAYRAVKRARENGVHYELVSIDELIERDGRNCHICGLPLDFESRIPEPKAATFDHLIPQGSWHGAHILANVRLAHFACNSIRSDRKITPKLIAQCRGRITGQFPSKTKTKRSGAEQPTLF